MVGSGGSFDLRFLPSPIKMECVTTQRLAEEGVHSVDYISALTPNDVTIDKKVDFLYLSEIQTYLISCHDAAIRSMPSEHHLVTHAKSELVFPTKRVLKLACGS